MDVKEQIDIAWNQMLFKQFREECEKYFGKNYWGLTISRCSEEEFQKWWEHNKDIEYNNTYYLLACWTWDQKDAIVSP